MMILAGDIGGTKTLLRLVDATGTVFEQRYESGRFASFESLLDSFSQAALEAGFDRPAAACVGVAGPVADTQARVTNLPWRLDATELQAHFQIPRFHLINDFQAVGYGLETLSAADICVLQDGQARPGAPRALIGAGTGLGEGILVWAGDHYEVLPSEGGHVDFAPTDPEQRELLAYLSARQARVSYENLVSGPGIVTIYGYFAQRYPQQSSPQLAAALQEGEGAAAISRAAAAGDELASRTLDLFVSVYGAQAGNLALTCLPAGGVYVAGGIASRIQARMQDGRFIEAFRAKDPMRDLLSAFPVYLVLNSNVGVQGAAAVAWRLLA